MAPTSTSSSLQSGLKAVNRDWTDNDTTPTSSQPQGSQCSAIEWPPSPEYQKKAPLRELSSYEKRLKAIQEGLNSTIKSSRALLSSNTANIAPSQTLKRSSPEDSDSQVKKKRVLPPGYNDNSIPSASTSTSRTSMGSTNATIKAEKSTLKPARVFLSQEQTQILQLVEKGESVFYTGSAGTGKSVLLREIIKSLRRKYQKSLDAVAITASTGIAACNIGGVTIHSFAGIGLGIESAEHLAQKIKKNRKASGRWQRTQVLIIDEVSMVDGDLFDKLARIGSMLRNKTEPFGGIQLIVTGDFFQLPPVTKGSTPKFAFEAQLWSATVQRTFNLKKVFRQTDQAFVDMLNEMRFGRLSQNSISKFKSLSRSIEYDDGIGPTELFPRREDVNKSNTTRMSRLQTEEQLYRATDGGTITDPQQREKMLANFMAPGQLLLKVDSQVMLIKNMDDTLVNGSMGKVVRFQDPDTYKTGEEGMKIDEKKKKTSGTGVVWPIVAFPCPGGVVRQVMIQPEVWTVELPNGEVQLSRSQLPLILAWAMSIHKSQGQTLERVKVDLGKVFEKGQAYVALSRATCLDGLQVLNFDPAKVMAHPKVVKWSESLEVIS